MSAGSMPDLADDLAKSNDAPTLEFAYVDETGNTGDVIRGGSRTYTLGCVLVPATDWVRRLETLTAVRREIKTMYGVRLRDELKANYLTRPRGPLKDSGLGDGQRRDIYRRFMRALNQISTGIFAVVVDKENMPVGDPFVVAWELLMQQLLVRGDTVGHPTVLVHDNGENDEIRALHRKCRQRRTGADGDHDRGRLLIEDPIPRRSNLSYFVQAADLVAYAAFRRIQPPGNRAASVCDFKVWEDVKELWITDVGKNREDGILL